MVHSANCPSTAACSNVVTQPEIKYFELDATPADGITSQPPLAHKQLTVPLPACWQGSERFKIDKALGYSEKFVKANGTVLTYAGLQTVSPGFHMYTWDANGSGTIQLLYTKAFGFLMLVPYDEDAGSMLCLTATIAGTDNSHTHTTMWSSTPYPATAFLTSSHPKADHKVGIAAPITLGLAENEEPGNAYYEPLWLPDNELPQNGYMVPVCTSSPNSDTPPSGAGHHFLRGLLPSTGTYKTEADCLAGHHSEVGTTGKSCGTDLSGKRPCGPYGFTNSSYFQRRLNGPASTPGKPCAQNYGYNGITGGNCYATGSSVVLPSACTGVSFNNGSACAQNATPKGCCAKKPDNYSDTCKTTACNNYRNCLTVTGVADPPAGLCANNTRYTCVVSGGAPTCVTGTGNFIVGETQHPPAGTTASGIGLLGGPNSTGYYPNHGACTAAVGDSAVTANATACPPVA